MVGGGAVALDDLAGRLPDTRRNLGEIGSDLRIVAGRQAPAAAAARGTIQIPHQCRDTFDQFIRGKDHRFVVNRQRSKRRHRFPDTLQHDLVQAARERQDPTAELSLDAVAELDDKRGVTGRQDPIVCIAPPGAIASEQGGLPHPSFTNRDTRICARLQKPGFDADPAPKRIHVENRELRGKKAAQLAAVEGDEDRTRK